MKILEHLLLVTLTLVILVGVVLIAVKAIETIEINECNKWTQQAQDYPSFYLADWQKEQCEHYGIEVFPVEVPSYIEVMATVYSYNSLPEQTDDTPFIMANGKTVYDGAVACPSYLTFGTNVLIEGRLYTCEDRMHENYRTGNNFDIWMPDKADSLEWGVVRTLVGIFE